MLISVKAALPAIRAPGFAVLLALLLVCALPPLSAAPAERHYRLFILDSQFGNPYDEVRDALLATLSEAGYRSGVNLQVDMEAAGNAVEQGERILQRVLDGNYDVVFVGGTVATIAARNVLYGRDQPVVFGSPTDPVGIGVIENFEDSPAANFTGVCYPVPPKARLRFIRQLLPHARSFGLIYADMPQSHSYNRWLSDLLASDPEFRDIRIEFRAVPLVTGEDGDRKMAELAIPIIQELNGRVDAFIKPNDQLGTRRPFSEVVWRHGRKPLIGIVAKDVMDGWGATAVVYPAHASIGRQSAEMIVRLFEGARVQDIRPEWPDTYGYAVDLPKTRRFGIRVPIGILQLAGKNIIKY